MYPSIELFFEKNKDVLFGELKPSKSVVKDVENCFNHFKSFWNKGNSTVTKSDVPQVLNKEVDDNTRNQNIRVMQEFGYITSTSETGVYAFTDSFISLCNSSQPLGMVVLDALYNIRGVKDLTMYLNYLLCCLREAYTYGEVILFPDSSDKFQKIVPNKALRDKYRQRIYEMYGFIGDTRRQPPHLTSDEYTPNASYMSRTELENLRLLIKGNKKDGLETLVLTTNGHHLLQKIDENLQKNQQKPTQVTIHTLENPIRDYVTQHDGEEIVDDELAKRYKKVYNSAGEGRQGIETQLFGIKYTLQLKEKPQSGPDSIVYKAFNGNTYGSMGDEMMRGVKIGIELRKHIGQFSLPKEILSGEIKTTSIEYINAIRTKPFLLLAGISGTGKSRIVREFAFKSCPKYLQDNDGTTPGNYCMIEVKPNWHDSTELLGYYSNLSKSYQFKKFVKFLVKAKMFPDVPFFVCLDEMNLAPVEQYFAEILSILETRKHPKKAGGGVNMSTISTGVFVDAKYFRELSTMSSAINQQTGKAFDQKLTDRDIYLKLFNIDSESDINEDVGSRTDLTTIGLTLPDNVIIIGTVNMDDTTHQFSRKVIDRAMTIEMNGGKLEDLFGGSKDLEYIEDEEEQKNWQYSFSQRYVTADEVLEAHPEQAKNIKKKLPERLEAINKALKGTPFEVSYRVLNELTIMVGVMLDDKKNQMVTIDEAILENIIKQAVNNILLMKILPRIEGDAEMFALSEEYKRQMGVQYNDRLEWLKALAPDLSAQAPAPTAEAEEAPTGDDVPAGDNGMNKDRNKTEGNDISSTPLEEGVSSEGNEEIKRDYGHDNHPKTAKEKIQEMIDRLNNQDFTRFWP